MDVQKKTIMSLGVKKTINLAGYLAFSGLVWTVENPAKRLVWTENVLSVFKLHKMEVILRMVLLSNFTYNFVTKCQIK